MPVVDFIYGPPRGALEVLRPTSVDMDTVKELAAAAKRGIDATDYPNNAPSTVTYTIRESLYGGRGVDVAAADLDGLSPHDRNTLTVTVDRGPASVIIQFSMGTFSAVHVVVENDQSAASALRRTLEDMILDNGEPILRPHLFTFLGPLAGAVAFLLLWIWVVVTTSLVLPAAILGWVISVGVQVAAIRWSAKLRAQAQAKVIRHRVRAETRATTIARRADEKRDAKVAIWTVLITAAVSLPSGFLLAVLTDAFGLKA